MITHIAKRLLLAAALLILTAPDAFSDGQVRIASWHRNLDAAVSLRFDDNLESHATTVIPQLNEHGFRATFLVSPGSPQYRARQEFWEQQVPAMGHRLGNHTMNHRGARTVGEADYEIGEAARTIRRVQPQGSRLLVFASGGGKKLWGGKEWDQADPAYRQLVGKYHLIDLYDGKHPSLSARSSMGTGDLCGALDRTLAQKGHQAYTFHAVGRTSFREWVKTLVNGYGLTIGDETFTGFLRCLEERRQRLWVAPLIEVLKYEREAREATMRLVRSDRMSTTLAMTVTTDPALYDQPLTLILSSRQGKTVRSVLQSGVPCPVYQGASGEFLAEVQPENSAITITYGDV